MNRSEAGRLGALKTSKIHHERRLKRIKEYNMNPNVCNRCGKVLTYDKRKQIFCSRSCSSSINNKGIRRHGNPPSTCINCGKTLKTCRGKYCSSQCQQDYQFKQYIDRWRRGEEDGTVSSGMTISSHIKRWLKLNKKHKCEICQNEKWLEKDIPLMIDHIDGNALNNRPENLRLICGNCDMQLPTYAGRNVGNGRKSRRDFYKKNGYC